MAGTSLFFDILARDHASATFNKVGNAAAALGKRTDQAGKSHQAFGRIVRWTGGMLSAYGVATYLKSSMQEYAKAEAAQNRLGNSYQRFPKMQNATLASFKELNKQLMLHTQFDDDDAAAMQANLGRFDLTGKQIQRLTPLVADLAQVQGTDLVTAGSAMGKAFLGNTRALKALGISYTATGNKAKDYRNIVDLINKKVGGESTKANQTAAVKLKMLENQWGELKETVGQAVLPAFNKLVEVAGPAITRLGSAVERNMPQIKQTFEDVYGAAKKLASIGKGIWDGFAGMDPGTRQLLLAMAGGTWAVGKIKGSALGQGLSTIFSAVKGMNVQAGVVNVNGKGVGGPGAKTGLPFLGGPLGMVTLIATGAVIFNAKQHANDPRAPMPSPAPGPMTVPGNAGRPWVSQRNKDSDFISSGSQQRAMSAWAARYAGQWSAIGEKVRRASGAFVSFKSAAKEQKWIDDKQPKALDAWAGKYKALAKAVKDVPSNKKVNVTDSGSAEKAHGRVKGLGAAIGALRGKRVRVEEDGAQPSRTRVKNLGGAIGALKGKTVPVNAQQTGMSTGEIQGLGGAINALPSSKTVTITVKRLGGSIGVGGQATGGYIAGPGTATSDSIPAMLSNGEYVIQAAAVDKYGIGMFHRLNAMKFAKGGAAKKPGKLQKELNQAKAEANRQQQIAAKVEKLGLGETAISYLGGMSSKAALKALNKPKALRKSARKASSLSDLQTRRDNAKQAAADAAQKAIDDQQAAADAAAEAAQKEADAQKAVRDAIEESASSYRSFASIATTSVTDVAEAQQKLTESNDAVAEAQKKMDLAGSDRDRAAAAQELAKALQEQQAAQQGVNAAGKPSTTSIRANMAGKLTRLKEFSAAVKQLKANGLNATTLADILAMGPEQGYDFAKALLDGGLADINALQADITATSADLGLTSAGVNSASATAIGQANAAAGGLSVALVPAPVTLQMNGREIASALLEYQRQGGG